VVTSWNSEDSFWQRTVLYSAAAVLVVVAGGLFYYFKVVKGAATKAPAAAVPHVRPRSEAPPEAEHHPVPVPPADTTPLPPLNDSDPAITEALATFFGKKPIEQLLVPNQVVRHFVVTVDNLPRKKVAEQMRPVKPTPGETIAVIRGESITLSAENSARYAAVMKLIQNADMKELGALYIRFYPLFQQSYEDLGYPGQYFNDRLVEVIDHLLQTPDLRGPVVLRQGRVFYEFADPELEARSAGQKLLLRMGSANAEIIKQKLMELRTVVTTSQDPPADARAEEGVNVKPDATPMATPGEPAPH
jgi:Protein of unknown function (DUF3014)